MARQTTTEDPLRPTLDDTVEATRPGPQRSTSEPVTERGRRTRAALVTAAGTVFAERGYHDATVGDITSAAAVAHGTFYTYFESKRDLFIEVIDALVEELRTEAHALPRTANDPFSRIERANRGYVRAYRRNAALMGVLEQVAMVDDDLRAVRLKTREFWIERAVRNIDEWKAEGLARADIDTLYVAEALGAMVDRFAFLWMVLGVDFDEDRAVDALNDIYAAALGLQRPT